MTESKKKTRSFGGIYIDSSHVSPPVAVGRDETRKESKMYNFNLNYEQVLRLKQSLENAATYLSEFHENSKAHKDGIIHVINFETGRIDFQKP